jgi:hypothetical protein
MSFANTVQLSSGLSQRSGSTRKLSIPIGSLLDPRSSHFTSLPLYFCAAPAPFCAPLGLKLPAKRAGSETGTRGLNPSIINTSKKSHFNPSTINTYENARLKVEQNQHLQKKGGVPPLDFHFHPGALSSSRSPPACTASAAEKYRAFAVSKSLRCADGVG